MFCGGFSGSPVYLRRTISAPRQGRVSIGVWLKDGIGTGPTPALVGFAITGGASIMTSVTAGASWVEEGGASAGVSAGTQIEIRLGLEAAVPGQCVTFDDVVVYVRP
jgi:hypothetical protein